MTEREKIDRLIIRGYSISVKDTEANNFSDKYKVYKRFRIGSKLIENVFVVDDKGEVRK